MTIDPLAVLPTLGNGFSIVDGGLTFDPMEVIPLGDGLTLSSDGVLSLDPSIVSAGGGDTVIVENPYELPTMSETLKGGAKVGDGLYMDGDILNVDFPEIESYCQEYIEQAVDTSIKAELNEGHMLGLSVREEYDEETCTVPFCVRVYKNTAGVNPNNPGLPGSENWQYLHYGALVLPAEYMEIDFKCYYDDQFTQEVVISGNTHDTQDNGVWGTSETLSPYEGTGGVAGGNVATAKHLEDGNTVIPIDDKAVEKLEGYIFCKWGTESELGNVNFKTPEVLAGGIIEIALPSNPKHGTLCFRGSSLYLYNEDKKKWLKWAVTATDTL